MQTKLNEEQELQLMQETRELKRTLKGLSKNQLILLLMQQVNIAVEMQNVNKVLLEKLKELEPQGQKEEPKNV